MKYTNLYTTVVHVFKILMVENTFMYLPVTNLSITSNFSSNLGLEPSAHAT